MLQRACLLPSRIPMVVELGFVWSRFKDKLVDHVVWIMIAGSSDDLITTMWEALSDVGAGIGR